MVEVATVDDIGEWDSSLRDLTDGLGGLFTRPRPRATFGLMVWAMLSDVTKQNSWGLAEHVGLVTPEAFEYLLSGANGTRMRCGTPFVPTYLVGCPT